MREGTEGHRVQETIRRLLGSPVLVFFGTVLPWTDWIALGPAALAAVGGVLLLGRFPAIIALGRYVVAFERPIDAGFVGWFGSIGIAAIFYAALAVRHTGSRSVRAVGNLVVDGSILVHGAASTPLTKRHGAVSGPSGGRGGRRRRGGGKPTDAR